MDGLIAMPKLNYQELVAGYYDSLNNNLRNFRGGPGFLETWVHDEDHNRSLLEILDLAHENGIDDLEIQLPEDVRSTVNIDWLRRNSADYGSIELKGETLNFSNVKSTTTSTDEFEGFSDIYTEALKQHAKKIAFEGDINDATLTTFSATGEGGTLSLGIDAKGIVKEAKHKAFKGVYRPLIDTFCSVMTNRSFLEGFEHAAIRAEHALRDQNRPRPVKGLLTPENADPHFAAANKLVRTIWYNYLKATGQEAKRNFWRDPIPESWLNLSDDDRLKAAYKAVLEGCTHFGLQTDVLVPEIKADTRFVLSYSQNKEKPDFGRHMIKLEKWLREKMGFEVELLLESIEDRNKRVERTKR
jgi:hypothetical protein